MTIAYVSPFIFISKVIEDKFDINIDFIEHKYVQYCTINMYNEICTNEYFLLWKKTNCNCCNSLLFCLPFISVFKDLFLLAYSVQKVFNLLSSSYRREHFYPQSLN